MIGNVFEELSWHVGHDVEVVSYGRNGTAYNVSLECSDCGMVLMSFDNPKIVQAKEPQAQVPSSTVEAT